MRNINGILAIVAPLTFVAAVLFGLMLLFPKPTKEEIIEDLPSIIIEIEYQGCEYIKYYEFHKGSISHKGNCKNPIHACH